jgi:hypothetical protein
MSDVNRAPSKVQVVQSQIVPQSVAAAATVTSGWFAVKQNAWLKIISLVGAGAGTFAVKVEQATSSGGAGAKDLITAANLGITAQATGTPAVQADVKVDLNLDVDNAYAFVRLSATCTGGAGTLFGATIEAGPQMWQS